MKIARRKREQNSSGREVKEVKEEEEKRAPILLLPLPLPFSSFLPLKVVVVVLSVMKSFSSPLSADFFPSVTNTKFVCPKP